MQELNIWTSLCWVSISNLNYSVVYAIFVAFVFMENKMWTSLKPLDFFFFFPWWSQKMSSLAHQTSLRSCLKPLLTNDRKQIGVCSSPKVCVYHNRHAKDSYFSLEWDSSDLSSTDPVERNSHFSVKVIHPKVGIQVTASLYICCSLCPWCSHIHCKRAEQALCHSLSIQANTFRNFGSWSGTHAQVSHFSILQCFSTESKAELCLEIRHSQSWKFHLMYGQLT